MDVHVDPEGGRRHLPHHLQRLRLAAAPPADPVPDPARRPAADRHPLRQPGPGLRDVRPDLRPGQDPERHLHPCRVRRGRPADGDDLRRGGAGHQQHSLHLRRQALDHDDQLHRRLHRDHRPGRRFGDPGDHRRAGPHHRAARVLRHLPGRPRIRVGHRRPLHVHLHHLHAQRQGAHGHRTGQLRLVLRLRPVRPYDLGHRPGHRQDHDRLHRQGPGLLDQGRGRTRRHLRLRPARPGLRHLDGPGHGRPHLHRRREGRREPAHRLHL